MFCKYYKPYMDTLRKIIGEYYQMDNGSCCCGGPLHTLLDDDNYDISSINYCLEECFSGLCEFNSTRAVKGYSKEVYILGIMICNEYAKMSLEERGAFDAYMTGQRLDCCCGNCEDCDILGELHNFMKENEDNYYERIRGYK